MRVAARRGVVGADAAAVEVPHQQGVAELAEVTGRMVLQPASDPVLAQQGRKVLAPSVKRFVALSSKAICPKP